MIIKSTANQNVWDEVNAVLLRVYTSNANISIKKG